MAEFAGWRAGLSCGACGSSGSHSTADCPYRAKRTLDEAGAAVMRDHRGEYNELDQIWTHPGTGSRLFLGNYTASKSLETLEARRVTHVVNCMARNTEGCALKDRVQYYRFPIETWEGEMVRRGGDPGGGADGDFVASEYFEELFGWLDAAMGRPGQAVLIHCFAGAHRAAAVSVAYLMHATGLNLQEALKAVREVRPIADPYGILMELLERLDVCLGHGTAAAGEGARAPIGNNGVASDVFPEESRRRQRKIAVLQEHEAQRGLNVQQRRILEALLNEEGT